MTLRGWADFNFNLYKVFCLYFSRWTHFWRKWRIILYQGPRKYTWHIIFILFPTNFKDAKLYTKLRFNRDFSKLKIWHICLIKCDRKVNCNFLVFLYHCLFKWWTVQITLKKFYLKTIRDDFSWKCLFEDFEYEPMILQK